MEMSMCRSCLSTKEHLVPLDETFILNYNLLTNLNISTLDNMPQYSCETCQQAVHSFTNFREKSISSEMMLRDLLQPNVNPEKRSFRNVSNKSEDNTSAENIIDPKLEIKEEEHEDFSVLDMSFDYEDEMNMTIDQNNKELADVKPKRSKRVAQLKEKAISAQKIEEDNKLLCELAVVKPKGSKRVAQLKKKTISVPKIEEDDKLHCGVCPKTFEERSALNNHIETHKNHKQCTICLETFNNWFELLSHRLAHVPEKQNKCHICLKRFCEPPYLQYHYMKIHFGETPKIACKDCPKLFENPRKLKNHRWSVHQGLKYFCDFCNKGFGVKSSLRSHLKKHSEKKAFACDLCEYSSKQQCGLKTHKIRKHSAFEIYCKHCGKVFKSQEDLETHICKQLVYAVCPICGVYQRSKYLNRHIASHSNVTKYECTRCPAKYKTQSGLNAHMDRHDGNRTKECEYCHAKFYTLPVLIKHRRTHTGEKPYVCKICKKGFTGNHNLKVHMRVHGEYLINKKDKTDES